MKILKIVGPAGAGKSTCLEAYMVDRMKKAKQKCLKYNVGRGQVNRFKQEMKRDIDDSSYIDQVYIDFEGHPTPAFMRWLEINLPVAGVKFLVIAHGE